MDTLPQYGLLCPVCDWPHDDPGRGYLPQRSVWLTEQGAADPLVPPRHEWPFGGEGIADAFIDRLGRLCFEYAV